MQWKGNCHAVFVNGYFVLCDMWIGEFHVTKTTEFVISAI